MSAFTAENLDACSFNSVNFSRMGFTCACLSAFVRSDDDAAGAAGAAAGAGTDDDDESVGSIL